MHSKPHGLGLIYGYFLLAGFASMLFFAGAETAYAEFSVSNIRKSTPSTVYPGDSYTIKATITNNYSVKGSTSKQNFYYSKNGGTMSFFCEASGVTLNAGASTDVSCSRTTTSSEPAGTSLNHQVNAVDANTSQTYNTGGSFTIATRPVATASITGNSPISYNSTAYLTVGSTYANSCSVSGGGSWYSHDIYYTSGTWSTGNLISDTTFSVKCTGTSGANNNPSASITISVTQPVIPKYSIGIATADSTRGSADCTGCGSNISEGTSITAKATSANSAKYAFSSWSWSGSTNPCSGAGSTCSFNAAQSGTLTANFSLTSASFSVSSMRTCDGGFGTGNCSSTLYAGTGYYSASVTNTGGSSGDFAGEFQYKVGSNGAPQSFLTFSSRTIAGDSSSNFDASNPTGASGVYFFRFCRIGMDNCTGWVNPTFITKPTLSGPSSVNSGGTATFTVSYDSARTPSYSNYTCGSGGSFISSTDNQFTCSYTNTSGNTVTATPGVTVTQDGISSTPSTSVSVAAAPTFNYSLGNSGNTTIIRGNLGTVDISKTLLSGTTESVSLSVTGLPTGSTSAFSNNPSNPSSPASVSVLSMTIPASAQPGNYTVNVNGSKLNKSTSFTLTVGLPQNSLGVQTTLDGTAFGGITITQIAGEPSDMGGITSNSDPSYYSRQTTSDIDVTLRAPSLSGVNVFHSWSGCDPLPGTTGRDCRVQLTNGASQTATARYLSPAALPNITVSTQVKGATKTTGGWLAHEPGQPTSFYLIATAANSGGTQPGSFLLKLTMKHLGDNTEYGETKTIDTLSQQNKASIEYALHPGTWRIEACADGGNNAPGGGAIQEGDENDNCSTTQVTLNYESPPDPMPTCWAQFTNVISGTAQWEVNVSGRIEGCPSSRYRFLSVSGNADNTVPLTTTFSTVFDLVWGLYRNMTSLEVDTMCVANNSRVIQGPVAADPGDINCDGAELQFAIGAGTPEDPYLFGGSSFSKRYRNSVWDNLYLFVKSELPWGNYPFNITNYFEGQYACTLGGVQKHYHAVCDPKNVDYAPAEFQDPAGVLTSCAQLPADHTSSRTISPDWQPFSIDPTMRVCAEEGAAGSEDDYFDMGCVPANPASKTEEISCGMAVPTNPPYKPTQQAFTPPVTVPQQPARPTFTHRLDVKSTKDNVSTPGVVIAQYSVSPAGYGPTGGGPGPFTNFGGTTDYFRLADKNFTIYLDAPPTHPNGGVFKDTGGWTDCKSVEDADPSTPGNDKRRCRVDFTEFSSAGGQTKTVTANYTSTLAAPTVLTNTPDCRTGAGKVQVWMPSGVANATGYRLYGSASPNFTVNASTLLKDFAPGGDAPPIAPAGTPAGTVPANAWTHTQTGTPANPFYYTFVAYNSSVSSAASTKVSDDPSILCPDLVVDSIAAPGTIYKDEIKTFQAVIKNNGGPIPADITSFDNVFTLYNGTGNAIVLPRFTRVPLSGMNAAGASQTITSGNWTAPLGSYRLRVCADARNEDLSNDINADPPHDRVVDEYNGYSSVTDTGETNNCSATTAFTVVERPVATLELKARRAGVGSFALYPSLVNPLRIPYDRAVDLQWTGQYVKNCTGATSVSPMYAIDGLWSGAKPNPTAGNTILGLKSPVHSYTMTCTIDAPAANAGTLLSSRAVVVAHPDLVISSGPSVSSPNGTIRPGNILSFTATVKNNGANAGAFFNRFQVLNSAGAVLYRNEPSQLTALAAGASQAFNSSVQFAAPEGSLTYTLQACADTAGAAPSASLITQGSGSSSNVILELNDAGTAETNNCSTSTFTVTPKPNLQANVPSIGCALDLNNKCILNQPVTLSGTIKNVGAGPTTKTNLSTFSNLYMGSFNGVDGWFTIDTRPLVTPVLMPAAPISPAVPVNHAVASKVWGENGEIADGSKVWFMLCADQPPLPNGIEPETNEGDNCSVISAIAGPYEFIKRLDPVVDLLFKGELSGNGGKMLIDYNTSGLFTWKTWTSVIGETSCSASNNKSNPNWTGINSKPNRLKGFDTSTDGYKTSPPTFSSGNLTDKTDFTLSCPPLLGAVNNGTDTVTVIPLTVTCSADKTKAAAGQTVTWTANVKTYTGAVPTFSWQHTPTYALVSPSTLTSNPVSVTYGDIGNKTATVTVTLDTLSKVATCGTPVEVGSVPTLTVKSTRDGNESSTNPSLNPPGVAITGTQSGTGGITRYTVTNVNGVSTTLETPSFDTATPPAKFIGWTCTTGSTSAVPTDAAGEPHRRCTIAAGIGEAKTVTANYKTPLCVTNCGTRPIDIKIEGREAGTIAWQPVEWNHLFNKNIELRWWSPSGRCTSGTASGDWSGTKTIPNAMPALPLETINQPFTIRDYPFTLTCTDASTKSSAVATVTAHVKGPDLTVPTPPTVTGTKIGNTFVKGEALTFKDAVVRNDGTAAATMGSTYKNLYQISVGTSGVWIDLSPAVTFTPSVASLGSGSTATVGNGSYTPTDATTYKIRVCADQKVDEVAGYTPSEGTVAERKLSGDAESESSNCSAAVDIPVATRPQASLDLKVRKNGTATTFVDAPISSPLQLSYNDSGEVQWTGQHVTNCTASTVTTPTPVGAANWTGAKTAPTATTPPQTAGGIGPLINARYTYTLTCTAASDALTPSGQIGGSISDTVVVDITAPAPDSMTCAATPNNATDPFQGAEVTWKASGAPEGTTGYSWSSLTSTYSVVPGTGTGMLMPTLKVSYSDGGGKNATVSATAPGGRPLSATCSVTVKTAPDLTVSSFTVTGPDNLKVPGKTNAYYQDSTLVLTLAASVKNGGTGATPDGRFRNLYLVSLSAPSDESSWTDMADYGLQNSSTALQPGETPRAVGAHQWSGMAGLADGTDYYLRACADQKVDNVAGYASSAGSVTEKNAGGDAEQNNCVSSSGVVKVTIYQRPVPKVDLVIDALASPVDGNDNQTTQPDIITANYNTNHTLRWKGKDVAPDSCTLKRTLPLPESTILSNGPTSNATGVSTGALVNAQYIYTIECDSAAGSLEPKVTDKVTVNIREPEPPVSCSASPSSPKLFEQVTWSVQNAPNGSTNYSWTGSDGLTGSGATAQITYQDLDPNPKTASFSATAPGNRPLSGTCSAMLTGYPDLTAAIALTGSKPVAGEADTYYDDGTITLSGTVKNVGTAATANGSFSNLYQYRIGTGSWQDIEARGLASGAPVQSDSVSRDVSSPAATIVPIGTSAGISYTYRMCADQTLHTGADKNYVSSPSFTSVDERNAVGTAELEASNCSPIKTITVKSFPDLIVSRKPAPVQEGRLVHGTAYAFSGDVQNAGTYLVPDAPSFANRFRIIPSSATGGATAVLQGNTLSDMSVSEIRTVTSENWTARAGKHTVELCADTSDAPSEHDRVLESSETNNCSPGSVSLGASTADVYPKTPAVSPSQPTLSSDCGGRMFLSFSGGEGGKSFALYRAKGTQNGPTESFTFLEEQAALSDLRKNAAGQNVDTGLDTEAWYHYLVDAIGPDTLTTSSTVAGAKSSKACTANLPDLVAVSVEAIGTKTVGSPLSFSGTVKNNGNADVTASFTNRFTLSKDGSPVAPSFTPRAITGGLPEGDTKPVNTAETWIAEAGTYNIKLCADDGNTIVELPNGENSGGSDINCTDTNFTVTSTPPPPGSYTLTVTVVGNGTVTSDVSGTGGSAIDCVANNAGTCSATYTESTPVILTAVPSGSTFSPGWSGDGENDASAPPKRSVTMSGNKSVTATFTGGTPPPTPGRSASSYPTVSCSVSPNQTVLRNYTQVNWTADPDGGSGLYRQFTFWFDDDNLPNPNPDYDEDQHTSEPRQNPIPDGYSYAKTYPTVGTKRARVQVVDSNGDVSEIVTCPAITVSELCPSGEAGFEVRVKSDYRTLLWLAEGNTEGTPSDTSNTTQVQVIPAGNCPTFSSTVNLSAQAQNSGVTDNGTLVFNPILQSQNENRRRAYYDSEVPNASAARDSLTGSTYSEGAEISFRRRVQGGQSISKSITEPPTSPPYYAFQVCGTANGFTHCTPTGTSSLKLQVGGPEPQGNQPGGTLGPPKFEEF